MMRWPQITVTHTSTPFFLMGQPISDASSSPDMEEISFCWGRVPFPILSLSPMSWLRSHAQSFSASLPTHLYSGNRRITNLHRNLPPPLLLMMIPPSWIRSFSFSRQAHSFRCASPSEQNKPVLAGYPALREPRKMARKEQLSLQVCVVCHQRSPLIALKYGQKTTTNHHVEQLIRGPSARGLRVRGQDRVSAFPCPSGRQHVLPLPSPPFREDAGHLHVGGDLPRQEGTVQRALPSTSPTTTGRRIQSSTSTSGTAGGTLQRTWRHGCGKP